MSRAGLEFVPRIRKRGVVRRVKFKHCKMQDHEHVPFHYPSATAHKYCLGLSDSCRVPTQPVTLNLTVLIHFNIFSEDEIADKKLLRKALLFSLFNFKGDRVQIVTKFHWMERPPKKLSRHSSPRFDNQHE